MYLHQARHCAGRSMRSCSGSLLSLFEKSGPGISGSSPGSEQNWICAVSEVWAYASAHGIRQRVDTTYRT
eukprot:5000569-Alexandrium_andersonii.AAC.1